jgi:hypothetical protein
LDQSGFLERPPARERIPLRHVQQQQKGEMLFSAWIREGGFTIRTSQEACQEAWLELRDRNRFGEGVQAREDRGPCRSLGGLSLLADLLRLAGQWRLGLFSRVCGMNGGNKCI